MNVNKKFQKLHQWGKGKMGSESKAGATDDLKALETEMNMRHEGLEKMHSSMGVYVKSLNKRSEGDGREKMTAIGYVASAMNKHGEVFEDGNKFGECLMGLGQANERIARFQDAYASSVTSSWLEALERSLAQMKDYQNARKKLESRRSTYESSLARMQKAKKEDYKAEEELRAQKAKYEESTEDVYRRMQDIIETEQDNSQDVYGFLEAELNYHDRCREVLLQAKRNWPVPAPTDTSFRGPARSRTNTLSRMNTNNSALSSMHEDDEELAPPLPFRPSRSASGSSSPAVSSPMREAPGFDFSSRPTMNRTNTTDSLSGRVPSRGFGVDIAAIRSAAPLKPMKTRQSSTDVFADTSGAGAGTGEDDITSSSPDRYYSGNFSSAATRSSSPATSVSQGTPISRNTSYSALDNGSWNAAAKQVPQAIGKKAPPPPPPSRGSKPPPPPPPMKRSALSSSSVPSYS